MKKTILGVVIGLGLALTGSVAFASLLGVPVYNPPQTVQLAPVAPLPYNPLNPYILKALDPLEVPTQKVYSKLLDTNNSLAIYKFTDGPATCYVTPGFNARPSAISCVK